MSLATRSTTPSLSRSGASCEDSRREHAAPTLSDLVRRPARLRTRSFELAVKVFCGRAQCGELLGTVGTSILGSNPNPVWRIEPGWAWEMAGSERGVPKGVLSRIDPSFNQQARLLHAT